MVAARRTPRNPSHGPAHHPPPPPNTLSPYYDDGAGITIWHGDCREVTAWLDADVLVTDPPYGIGWRKNENKAAGSRSHGGIANDQDTMARDTALALWGDRPGLVFGSFYAAQPVGVKQWLVWKKPPDAGVVGSVHGWRRDVEPVFVIGPWPQRSPRWSSVIHTNTPSIGGPFSAAGTTGHPHAKPIGLMRDLVDKCPPGTVADPFMGSGSTLRAAKDLGRRAIGVEIDERYCEIAAKRLGQEVLALDGAA